MSLIPDDFDLAEEADEVGQTYRYDLYTSPINLDNQTNMAVLMRPTEPKYSPVDVLCDDGQDDAEYQKLDIPDALFDASDWDSVETIHGFTISLVYDDLQPVIAIKQFKYPIQLGAATDMLRCFAEQEVLTIPATIPMNY